MDPVKAYIYLGRMMVEYQDIIENTTNNELWVDMIVGYAQLVHYRSLLSEYISDYLSPMIQIEMAA